MASNIAISYARFSSGPQAQGDSFRRQTEASEKYVAEHGLVLDKSLSFTDLGVSAYDGSNVKNGSLKLFLKAVEEGRVPVGATLIIESLDRLSRAQALDALGVFTDILNAGLKIVTLTDRQLYSRESVQQNPLQLIASILIMQRAHEESATKSMRIAASWDRKKRSAVSDGTLMTKRAPHWINVQFLDGERKAILMRDRAQIALRIVEMAEKGTGNSTIIRQLHADGVPAWSISGKWEPSYIQKLLSNPALYGGIKINGEMVEGYYPSIIDRERFLYLQSVRAARATRKNTNRKGKTVTNLFSGLLKCGYCGSSMNIAGYKSRASGYERKYVACHGARTGATQCKMTVWFLDELEPSLLFWLTSLDLSWLPGVKNQTVIENERKMLAVLEQKKVEIVRKIDNLTVAIEDGGSGLIARFNALGIEKVRIDEAIEKQSAKLVAVSLDDGGVSRMKALVILFKTLKSTTDEIQLRSLREQLSSGIASTVKKITLYPLGQNARETKADRFIDVNFVNGAMRRIESGEC